MPANTIDHTRNRDWLLRHTMRADAVISGFFGVAGLTGWVSEFSGAPDGFVRGVATFFVAYGVAVLGLAVLPSLGRAGLGVVIANGLYTLAAVLLVVTHVFRLTPAGGAFAVASAVYTLVFARWQYVAWRRIESFR